MVAGGALEVEAESVASVSGAAAASAKSERA